MPIFYRVEQKYYHVGGQAFYITQIEANKLPDSIDEYEEDHDSYIDFFETKTESWQVLMVSCLLSFQDEASRNVGSSLLLTGISGLIGGAIKLLIEQEEHAVKIYHKQNEFRKFNRDL